MFRSLIKSVRLTPTKPLKITKCYSTKFEPISTPSPPKLPEEDQKEFERLQKVANSSAIITEYNENLIGNDDIFKPIEQLKTIPEFEGDVNPKTGERGGPKQDPLRHGDYSFNGRVTDF